MRNFLVLAAACGLPLLTPAAFAADPCSFLSQADAAALTGQQIASVDPSGPTKDEDSGGELIFCSYRSAGAAVVVSIVEFPSEAAARKQLGSGLINDRMGADDAKVVEERGIGEKAFYGASAKGSMYVFLRKNKVGGVGVGGPGKAADLKDALRKAAQSVAAKL